MESKTHMIKETCRIVGLGAPYDDTVTMIITESAKMTVARRREGRDRQKEVKEQALVNQQIKDLGSWMMPFLHPHPACLNLR